MTTLDQLLTDPALLIAIAVWIGIQAWHDEPLKDGFHQDGTRFVVAISVVEVVIFSYLTRIIVDVTGLFGTVPRLQVTWFGTVLAGLFILRHFDVWQTTWDGLLPLNRQSVLHLASFLTAITFGAGIGVAALVMVHPSATRVELLYQQHVNFAVFALQEFQAILSLQLAVLEPVIAQTVSIYRNNVRLAFQAGGIGIVGGFAGGLLIPIVLVMAMNTALIWGVFTGILARNTLVVTTNPLAPGLSYLASLGLLIVGHTFHEFMAIVVTGVGGGVVGYGLYQGSEGTMKLGSVVVGIGLIQLAFAAFVEVWFDPRFINYIKGVVTIEPTVVPLPFKAMNAGSVGVTTIAVVYVVSWMIRITTARLENVI